jgi:hypothetical protein
MQRMNALRALLPHQLLLVEGVTRQAESCVAYGTGGHHEAPKASLRPHPATP